MQFEETLSYLEELSEVRMRLAIEPSVQMLEVLGRPDKTFKTVIVGGTNGKGSICAFLTAMANAAGLKVGTYTSPHLESVTERIALCGMPLSREQFAATATDVRSTLEAADFPRPSYFEFLTGMAAVLFEKEKVDLAIFEVGLGGRLDSTNALDRVATVISRIDYDHMAILGSTLSEIASEKAAIFRGKVPAMVSDQHAEVGKILESSALKLGTNLMKSGRDFRTHGTWKDFSYHSSALSLGAIRLSLPGNHQVENAATATATATALREIGLHLPDSAIEEGLKTAVNTGRLEEWTSSGRTQVWLDVGHNSGAALALRKFLFLEGLAPLHLVIGMLSDKDWRSVLEIFLPIASSVTLCRPKSERAWDPGEASKLLSPRVPTTVIMDPTKALAHAARRSTRLLCTGSFYMVGVIRKSLPELGYRLGVR